MSEFTLTKHACERAVDMALDPEFIRELMIHPDIEREAKSRTRPGDKYIHMQKADIAAICAREEDVLTIITFVPATEERWLAEDQIPLPGREFRKERW